MKTFAPVSLKSMNTLAFECQASQLIQVDYPQELPEVLKSFRNQKRQRNWLVLGGGSNVVLPDKLDRPILQLMSRRIIQHELSREKTLLYADAGVIWDDLVAYAVAHGLYGIENLSLIPGSVGAAPIQNIGAYGVELKDCLLWVWVWDETARVFDMLTNKDCRFGYRDSLFKQQPGRYIIMGVYLELSREPVLCLDYGDLRSLSDLNSRSNLTLEMVRNTVVRVRRQKLPDPDVIPNAGSFFKNPVIGARQAQKWRQKHPQAVTYDLGDGSIKVAAGWLIEQSGWKGYRNDRVGVHDKQALVLINHCNGSQQQLLELAGQIQRSVAQQFGLSLEIEPVVISS